MSTGRAVVLVGSPRPQGESTSETLAAYLRERLEWKGVESSLFRITRTYKEPGLRKLCSGLDGADLFVLATPLYVDSLPYLVTRALERIAAHRSDPGGRSGAMLAIVNCGFPEARHTRVALDICRNFARRTGFDWTGGLGLGGGEAIGGRRLQELGWMARNVARSLDMAADALVAREPLPAEAVALMARPLLHPRVYTLIATARWYGRAWKNGVLRQLRATPFSAEIRT